ncbi:MAG: hypothetical protein FJY86_01745 [Candidatus Diapherotrites archaeon]|uniref:Uncharacterized protein n=1 Tax=Candidatus Iainarchaeum sp. TaxID=3101447 RepID=A0A8T4C6Y4_9ARCH|nr:hypothetical protein [Candidatus Diapherotrites archaeon]
MPHSRRPASSQPLTQHSSKIERRPLVQSINEQRRERERHWSTFVDNFSTTQHRTAFNPLKPRNREVFHREMMAVLEPVLREKSFLTKTTNGIVNELLRDSSLTYERAITKISHLEEKYKRSFDSRKPESGQFMVLMHLLPSMKKAIFQGAVAAMYEHHLYEAGLSFKHEWVREFVEKITPEEITSETAHAALMNASSTGLIRAAGEWVIQKNASQKEGARHALLPVVKREVFAQRSRVRTELGKISDRLAPLGLSKTELLPFFRLLRKSILHEDSAEVGRVQANVREFARERMIQKLTALKVDARRLFTMANINLETPNGMVRFRKIVEIYDRISNHSQKAKVIRTRLLKWAPKSVKEVGGKQARRPDGKRRATIGFRQTFKERNFSISPSERLTLYNSRIRENKISNKQRVQLIERMILVAAQIPQYTRMGEIDIATLKSKTGGSSFASQYMKALNNLVRRRKLIRTANERYRLI